MHRREINSKLERVEQLLRAQSAAELPPDFKRRVMARIQQLPESQLYAHRWQPAAALSLVRQLSASERCGLGLILLGLLALGLPGVLDLLSLLEWELADFSLSLSFGDSALSASLASIAAVTAGIVALAAAGALSTRQHTLSA